jgi:tetratricopeptide (TPR) repeat protein
VLQDDVARAVANNIQQEFTPKGSVRMSARRRVDPAAFDAYLRGRRIFREPPTSEGVDRAIGDFTQAIDKDPNYAAAYAALAECYTEGMFRSRPLPPSEAWSRAEQAATRAVLLDDQLAEAHEALATVRFRYDWNWAEAEHEYQRSIELNPNDAHAHQAYATFLHLMRRTKEGAVEAGKAAQLDPLSPNASNSVAWSYAWAHRYDDAIQQERRTLELDPNYPAAHEVMARSYEAEGMWGDAVSEWLLVFTLNRRMAPEIVQEFRQAFDAAGIKGFWAKWLELDEQKLRRGNRPPLMEVARLRFLVGDKNASFGLLEKAYQERDPGLPNVYFAADWLEPARSDPRYVALIRRIGLPD